jgi:hypothetical protein
LSKILKVVNLAAREARCKLERDAEAFGVE